MSRRDTLWALVYLKGLQIISGLRCTASPLVFIALGSHSSPPPPPPSLISISIHLDSIIVDALLILISRVSDCDVVGIAVGVERLGISWSDLGFESPNVKYTESEIHSVYDYETTELVHEPRNGVYQWVVKPKTDQ
ncbi:hypothetical protein Droror1_Dr00024923 [Drosera rotundifolia]